MLSRVRTIVVPLVNPPTIEATGGVPVPPDVITIAKAGNRPIRVVVRNRSVGMGSVTVGLDPAALLTSNPNVDFTGYYFIVRFGESRTFIIDKDETLYAGGFVGAFVISPVIQVATNEAFSVDLEP